MLYYSVYILSLDMVLNVILSFFFLSFVLGLPIQVRDAGLSFKDDMPKSDVNTVLHAKYGDRDFQLWWNVASWHVGESHMHQWHAAQTGPDHPYYKRNWPHLCSFWVKGECKRGEECPYKHEKPTDPDDSLADQNIKDLMELMTLWQINS